MTKKSLEEFATGSISDSVFRDVFVTLVSKYKHESERQHLIRAIIEIYEKKYPEETKKFMKIMEKKRELLANEYGSDAGGERQRLVFKFPESLMKRFELAVKDPPILYQSNPMTKAEIEEWTWFMKNFPQYVVPSKI